MQEIKIPEGCKASIDFEKRVVVIESEKPKFKRGDIVVSGYFILPFMGINENEAVLFNCYYSTCNRRVTVKDKVEVGCGYFSEYMLATPSEQLLLFDALAKEGKKWNPETLQIEDIQKDILVPESIGIYRYNGYSQDDDGDGLLIGFNDNNQLLAFCNGYYSVVPYSEENYDKIQCKLIPCNREDLKAGDTVAIVNEHLKIEEVLSDIDLYNKAVGDREYANVEYGRNIQVYDEKISPKLSEHLFYKVEPINK